ncbi:MAG: hypothetical protein PHD39_09185 [Methylobacter tundripaludum]|nr:hypothetical protein [Methylobacter tundripaludum]
MSKLKKFILKKDIVIPVGTVFTERFGKREYGENCYESEAFGLTKDTSGDVFYGIEPGDPEMSEWFEEVK